MKVLNPIIGTYVTLREVTPGDAAFILSLRCDALKGRFLHETDNDIEKQVNYLLEYEKRPWEWYFLIQDKKGEKIGIYRIYDVQRDSFCIGSWLMVTGTSPYQMLEADLLTREFGFFVTGLDLIHFDVRKSNKKVVNYHRRMGAKVTGEDDLNIYFECAKGGFEERMSNFLPRQVEALKEERSKFFSTR